jgi:lysophospholipase L1-like esterase
MMHRTLKLPVILLLTAAFAFSMTVLIFFRTYQTVCIASYDYVALGDSYCSGQTPSGELTGYGYPDYIQEELADAEILGSYHKKGVSGYTTADVLEQLPDIHSILSEAEIITIDAGINDLAELSEFKSYQSDPSSDNLKALKHAVIQKIPEININLKSIVNKAIEAKSDSEIRIYLMGYFDAFPDLPELKPMIAELNDAIVSAALETGAVYVDTMAVMDKNLQRYLPGDMHPTEEGYEAIAGEFLKSIRADFISIPTGKRGLTDVKGHWAEDMIKRYADKEIITGFSDGSFQPDRAVTRAEFITIINRYFQLTDLAEIHFADVPEGAWYQKELQIAVKAGYVAGRDGSCFKADEKVTRQEAAVIIAKRMDFDVSETEHPTAGYLDGDRIPSWSLGSMDALLERDIMRGYPDKRIRYEGYMTRAEVLELLDNLTIYIDKQNPTV